MPLAPKFQNSGQFRVTKPLAEFRLKAPQRKIDLKKSFLLPIEKKVGAYFIMGVRGMCVTVNFSPRLGVSVLGQDS